MGRATIVRRRRELRKALGGAAADAVVTTELRVKAHGQLLARGFFGRFKWLIFGR
jgi:hypothetical protein